MAKRDDLDDVLARMTPRDRERVQRAVAAAARKAPPPRVSHGAPVERPLRPGGAVFRFPNRDTYERVKAAQRAYRPDARNLSMQQMTTFAARAAAMGMTTRELWWQMFGS